jgi:hypothetical protein
VTALTLTLTLFCLPAVQADTLSADQPKKETTPPKAVSDQYCIHLSIPNGTGGWKWDPQATHCENSEGRLCEYICRNYPSPPYTRVDCGCMATADKQYVIVPPRHTPNDIPMMQTICICVRQPAPIAYLSTCSPCVPVCQPVQCERPRLFPIFRRCR